MSLISKKKRRFIYDFKIIIWMLGTVLTLFACSSVGRLANNSSSKVPIVWVNSALERIGKTDQPRSTTEIQLYAARGEYEPFQIGIRAPNSGLTNVNISLSDLSNQNNQVIPKTNFTLYREHYVYVSHSSPNRRGSINPPLGPGWYADGLIPLKVWDFELPLKPSLNSSFAFWEKKSKSAMVELLKHKLIPSRVNPEQQRELIDKWGLRSLRLPFWSGADVDNCSMKPPPSVDDIRKAAAKHQSDLFLYARYADEIDKCSNLIEPVKQWARNFHKAGISTAIAMMPTPALYDDGSGTGRSAVDIWIVLPEMYDAAPQRISEVLQKGNKVWFYNALVQDGYSPKWQIDFNPINYRIPHGFINQSLGLTGVLYWRVDLWTKDPWNNVQTYSIKDKYYPGEGMLVYPGKQVGIKGVVPSMRLKWIREGVEDYEYIEILKRLGRKSWALEVSRSVGRDWKNWTRNPNALESVRRRLGEEIARLSSK